MTWTCVLLALMCLSWTCPFSWLPGLFQGNAMVYVKLLYVNMAFYLPSSGTNLGLTWAYVQVRLGVNPSVEELASRSWHWLPRIEPSYFCRPPAILLRRPSLYINTVDQHYMSTELFIHYNTRPSPTLYVATLTPFGIDPYRWQFKLLKFLTIRHLGLCRSANWPFRHA